MARHNEHTLNTVLAACLRKRSPRWRASNLLSSEDLAALEGPGRPDILAEAPGATPVAVETEYEPARTVEKDARSRLQQRAAATGREIEHAIAVKLPAELRDVPAWKLADHVEDTSCAFAVVSATPHYADTTEGPRRLGEYHPGPAPLLVDRLGPAVRANGPHCQPIARPHGP